MAEGTIKRLLSDRGCGFIDTGGGKVLFFHTTAVQGGRFVDLQDGQRVEYKEGEGPKGPQAEFIRPV